MRTSQMKKAEHVINRKKLTDDLYEIHTQVDVQYTNKQYYLKIGLGEDYLSWSIKGHVPSSDSLKLADELPVENGIDKGAKYKKIIRDRTTGDTIKGDVYDVLEAFNVTCPAMQHAIKKLLMPGERGSKGYDKDCDEGINSVEQSKLLQKFRKQLSIKEVTVKGYFQIRHDPYTGEIGFCNLSEASLGFLRDSFGGRSRLGQLVAHDVVEHSLSHRIKSYVTFEAEIRALGASSFVRPSHFDSYEQVLYQCMDMQRDVKPITEMMAKYFRDSWRVCSDMMKYLIKEGIEPKNARNAVYQFEMGYYEKSKQFDGSNYAAYQAFSLIERNIEFVCSEIAEHESWGASVYFDSNKHIFRHQLKRQHQP